MAMIDLGSRTNAPTTLIGEEEEGDHDDRDTLRTP